MKSERIPPHAYFVGSAVFHYLGPAFAVLLFVRVDALGVAWLRIAAAALVFALWRRPWRVLKLDGDPARVGRRAGADELLLLPGHRPAAAGHRGRDRVPAGDRARRARRAHAAQRRRAAARGGRRVPAHRHPLEGEPLGVALAFANAGLFALYIVLAHRAAQDEGVDALGASMLIAAVVVTPMAGWAAVPAFDDPVALLAGVGVGISSSVIPYVFDQLAMARLTRATYALMVSLLPATATVIGVVVLAQVPSLAEAAGVMLVIAGVAAHRAPEPVPASAGSPPPPPPSGRRSAPARTPGCSRRDPRPRSPA